MAQIKPGDLCITKNCVVPENNGKIVTVVALHYGDVSYPNGSTVRTQLYEIDREMKTWRGDTTSRVMGDQLIPIIPPDLDGFVLDEIIKELDNVS